MGVVDDLIATAQPRTEKVRICARGDLVEAWAEAATAAASAASEDQSLEGGPATIEATERVVAIEEEMDRASVEFTVSTVPREVWADLLAEHPPSKEQRRAGHDHDPKTFPVAALAACTAEPPVSLDQAQKLAKVLHAGEWNKLWVAILGLNVAAMPSPKLRAATDLLRANGRSSTTPPLEGSLEDGSSAGSGAQ